MRPPGYNPAQTDRICEHLARNEPCLEKQLCPYPHTEVERDLWKKDYDNHLSIAGLVSDLRESSLKVSVVTEYLSKTFNGTFRLICATCYKESGAIFGKLHHVPRCASSSGHPWEENKKLVFEIKDEDNQLVDFDDYSVHDEDEQELVSCVRVLMNDVTVDDIADEAARLRQSAISTAVRKTTDEDEKHEPYDSESDDGDNEKIRVATTAAEIFDEDASDLLNDAAFDEDTGDRNDTDAMGPRVRGEYYKMGREEMTQDNSEIIYGCGKIKLHGAFAGSCMIVGGELDGCDVELRGRVNCGPAFDDDEVQLKVYKKKQKAMSETDDSTQFYGTVVNVVKRNVHRTARTFVCTVGRHDGHLMTPLCGTAPKFHTVDTCLLNRYGPVKRHNYVAVYNSDLSLRKIVKLDPCMRKEMLFVVKYLKWENQHKYPLGYVCRVLRQSHSDKDSQKMLNLMYELPFNEDTELEMTEFEEKVGVDDERVGRKDLCKLLTVSVDPPGSKDVDDALSLKEVNGKYIVWTHIADVTCYVQKGDDCDMKAQSRILSFYPLVKRQPFHMLPKKFAEEKCSLLENSRRRAMSTCFELTAEGEVLETMGPMPSWIQNDKQFSYEEVQEIIDDFPDIHTCANQAIDQDVENMVFHLHELAAVLRERRMVDGSHFYEYHREQCYNREGIEDPFDFDQNHDASRLVEEFMILTNQHVGRLLRQKFPECTPFRVQSIPNDRLLESWNTEHGYIVQFSFYLRQYLPAMVNPTETPLFMLSKCWDAISDAVDNGDTRKVRTIIGTEQLHPLHNIALSSWFNIQERSEYECLSLISGGTNAGHYSLQTCDYVHFTSPLRRYVDVIAHRLVKADPGESPYTRDEVVALCKKMNARTSMQKSYDRSCGLVKIASMLPIYMPCYVETFDDFSIRLACPYFRTASPLACRLKFSDMTVQDNPVSHGGQVTLNWSKRYYDTRMSRTTNARLESDRNYILEAGMFGILISQNMWLSMHNAIQHQRQNLLPRVSEAVQAKSAGQQQQQQRCNTVKEVTSEMAANKPLVRHHVKFSCDITRGAVVSVQFGAETFKGFLQPVIKLVNITDDKDICVEHQRDPVQAFALVATRKVKDSYQYADEYQNIWQAILAMEAATNAVQNNESVTCSNVPVRFINRNSKIYGKIKLSKEFCEERFISISSSDEETHDYMCIRCFLKNTRLKKSFIRNVWVAHAIVMSSSSVKGDIELTVKCNCPDTTVPSELLDGTSRDCTVEFLQRALPDK